MVKFLLATEMIPLCLRIMEHGTELSKTVATFIVQKILLADIGLSYICHTYERFSHVALILVRVCVCMCACVLCVCVCVCVCVCFVFAPALPRAPVSVCLGRAFCSARECGAHARCGCVC